MNTIQIEHTLGVLRGRLVEWVSEDRWSEHRWEDVARTVRESLRGAARPAARPARRPEARLKHEELRRVTAYVGDHLDSKLTWSDIAQSAGMERFTLGRRFKNTVGITLHQYVIRRRVRKAMKLVREGRASLADIALEVGCSCQSHLTTLFRRYVGTTPGAFRRRPALLAGHGAQLADRRRTPALQANAP
jgi:AraC-like DNA-binding protein